MNRILRLSSVMLVIFFAAVFSLAQNVSTADLHGTVKDPKGSVVANATVTIRDASRDYERSTNTNQDGEYDFNLLPPGAYSMTVTAKGMAKLQVTDVKLTVGQNAELTLNMKVEAGKSEITVSAEGELVETAKTAVSNTIDQKSIDNLPINERNYIAFALTTSTVDRDHGRPIGPAPTSGLNIGGQRGRSTVVSVDGADFTDTSINAARTTLSQEAVQEFQVVTNSYAAEYGRASGGVINVISKSGTNDWHGNAFGFLRQRSLQATNPFSPIPSPPFTRTQYGATLGGAIKKGRTFIFLSFEQRRRQESGFFTSNVVGNMTSSITVGTPFLSIPQTFTGLTAAQVAAINAGILSGNAALTTAAIQYAYLASSGANNGLNGFTPTLSPGGSIPITPGTVIGPRFILTGAPLPTGTTNAAGQLIGFRTLNSLQRIFPIKEGTTFTSLRIDHKLNDKNQLVLRGGFNPSITTGIQPESQNQSLGQNDVSRTGVQGLRDLSALVGVTTTISPTLLNEARYNFGRRAAAFLPQNPDAVAFNIAGAAFVGRELFSPVKRVEDRHQVTDSITWSRGAHTFKFGGDFNFVNITAAFQLNFAGLYNFGGLSAATLGFPTAPIFFPDFTAVQQYGLGIPSNYIQGFGNPNSGLSNKPLAFFAQDSWKLRSNLVMNIGVRYDVEITQHISPVGITDPLSHVTMTASDIQAAQDVIGVQQGVPISKSNFAPRLGFAWDPMSDNKTIVRAAYGMFYDHPLQAIAFNSDIADAAQQQQLVSITGSPSPIALLNASQIFQGTVCVPGATLTPVCTLASTTPGVAVGTQYQFGRQRFNDQTFPGFGPVLPFTLPVAKNFKYGYAHQGSFSVERQITKDTTLTVGYLGVLGRHLPRPIDANAPNNSLLIQNFTRYTNGTAPTTLTQAQGITMPTANVGPGSVPGLTVIYPNLVAVNSTGQIVVSPAAANFFRPNAPNYFLAIYISQLANLQSGGILPVLTKATFDAMLAGSVRTTGTLTPFGSVNVQASNANSNYHALNVELKKRFSHNFSGTASYTWSHSIDVSSDLQTLLLPQDNRNLGAERSDSLFDQRHRFVMSGVWTSPVAWRSGSEMWQKIFADFTVAPIAEISTGRPFNIITNSDSNGDQSSQTDRPNLSGSTLTLPADFTTGSLGRNAGMTTMFTSVDLRISRLFRINERWGLDVIAEGFNTFNHFNEAAASPFYLDVNKFGQRSGSKFLSIPTASYDPRQFQFGLKLHW